MPLIALGWCRAATSLPDPLTVVGAGPIRVVACDAAATEPRDRLALLQMCHDLGADCLPAAPHQRIDIGQALAVARDHSADLLDQLQAISGTSQLTLRLTSQNAPPDTGRSFLQALQQRSNAYRITMDLLLAPLAVPSHRLRRTAKSDQADILVDRSRLAPLCQQIKDIARALPDSGLQLLLTGPWPPLAFAHAPRVVPA